MPRILKRHSIVAVLALILTLIVTACGGDDEELAATARPTAPPQATATPAPTPTPAATPTPRVPQGTLNIAIDSLGTEAWINRLVSGPENAVNYSIGEGLIAGHPSTRALQPMLATSWSVANVGSEWIWTFRLRPNTPFHDGNGSVTSEDVKLSFAEMLKPDVKVSVATGVKALVQNDMKNFEVVSPTEFKLRAAALDVSIPIQLSMLQPTLLIMPKAYYEARGDDGFQRKPVGSGPFIFKSHSRGQSVTLEAVPNHWRQTADIQTATYTIIPEPATRIAMLRTGQADMAVIPGSFKREASSGGLRTHSILKQANVYVSLGGMYYDLPAKNCTTCPWVGIGGNAQKVREALTIAIDRKSIVDKLLNGEAEPAAAPWMWTPGPFAFIDQSWKVPEYNPTRARQLLAEAGYPSGFSIKVAINSLPGFVEQADTGLAVASFWEDIGIKVQREQIEFLPTFRTSMVERNTSGYAWILNMIFQDEPLRNSRTLFNKSASLAYIHDPKFDEYIAKYGAETDLEKRMAAARELGSYVVEQRLGIPLFSTNGLWGLSAKVNRWENVTAYPYFNSLERITLKR